ncbi:hypothetical protein [Acinetobacter sp. ANC 3813]|uniref:hypothetical protein n=1 Tax=Acinetobacter sp. ANC 3813 TaxID=1977873 RepID=UPI000A32D0DB|nr:hypothetical protein [Acinetobacter sp. ANC 3813]OTG88914.1 hypothetical protein B9T34_14230 [Acinetobacter sp. ANC 3813]
MPQYLAIAEKVIESIKKHIPPKTSKEKLIPFIISEVRDNIGNTSFRLNEELCSNILSKNRILIGQRKVDLSLVPKVEYEEEFLLWLAGFIEQITIDENKRNYPSLLEMIRKNSKNGKIPAKIKFESDYVSEFDKHFKG